MNKKISLLERYLTKEIRIEFKACLYFFCILFFYCIYRLTLGQADASILHMAEMILLTYVMGYVQVFLLRDFDEGEILGFREICYLLLCSLIYGAASYFGNWFDGHIGISIGFVLYIVLTYVCTFLVYKCKREIDGKLLNEDLKAFQERRTAHEDCD